jgi:DNA-3-methyladenine glycosylase I
MQDQGKIRCQWAQSNTLFIPYHDEEWGVPLHDDQKLFEMLNLEGAQAGLSWLTILKKRAHYRTVFDQFDAEKIVNYDATKIDALLHDEGIIRNRLKINAVIENARAFLALQHDIGSFDTYIWRFVNNKPLPNTQQSQAQSISEAMSKDLKKRGFKFVGATICFAFMQANGLINDHEPTCFRNRIIAETYT